MLLLFCVVLEGGGTSCPQVGQQRKEEEVEVEEEGRGAPKEERDKLPLMVRLVLLRGRGTLRADDGDVVAGEDCVGASVRRLGVVVASPCCCCSCCC